LEKWWWLDETPQGFCPDSAYLAIRRLAFRLFALNSISVRFSTHEDNTINLRLMTVEM
jgi:hypothetical protein